MSRPVSCTRVATSRTWPCVATGAHCPPSVSPPRHGFARPASRFVAAPLLLPPGLDRCTPPIGPVGRALALACSTPGSVATRHVPPPTPLPCASPLVARGLPGHR